MKKALILSAIISSLALAGCGGLPSAVVTSFDDVTSDSEVAGKHSKFTQTKSIALNGLMPTLWPGDLCYDKPSRSASATICMTPGKSASFYRVRTVGNDVTSTDVTTVRNNIAAMVRTAEIYMEEKLALVKFDLAQASRGKDNKPTPAEQTSLDATRTTLSKAVKDAADAHNTAASSVENAILKPGIIVFQWDAETNVTAGASLAGMLGGAFSDSKKRSGFGIVGGVRVSQLFLGTDIHKGAWPQVTDRLEKSNSLVIPTTIYQAKNIAYFSEMERLTALSAELSATFEQLATLVEDPTALATAKLELSFAMSRMYKATNTALLNSGTVENMPMLWGDNLPSLPDKEASPPTWLTFYQVATSYEDIRNLVRKQDPEYLKQ